MRAKFDRILVPLAEELIAPEQRAHITFDAFFENVMFHEVAHGLGIKNTVTGKGTVREALTDLASSFEEGKADILGLYMITQLGRMGELDAAKLRDNYVTFLAGIFRSVRFGASSAHGQANMVAFNFLAERGAFTRDADGRYAVDFEKMGAAVDALSATILTLQGDGDYDGAKALNAAKGSIGPDLAADLARAEARGIPVDIVLRQGLDVLGLPAPQPAEVAPAAPEGRPEASWLRCRARENGCSRASVQQRRGCGAGVAPVRARQPEAGGERRRRGRAACGKARGGIQSGHGRRPWSPG
jgi:hypothetical protein